MDVLRTFLLITLLALLGAILYKRLLKFLGSEKAKIKFASFRDRAVEIESGMLNVMIEMPRTESIRLLLRKKGSEQEHVLADGEWERGEHDFNLPVQGLESGKYEVVLTSSSQTSTRYVEVE